MKRAIAFAIVMGLLSIGVLTGCKENQNEKNKTTTVSQTDVTESTTNQEENSALTKKTVISYITVTGTVVNSEKSEKTEPKKTTASKTPKSKAQKTTKKTKSTKATDVETTSVAVKNTTTTSDVWTPRY